MPNSSAAAKVSNANNLRNLFIIMFIVFAILTIILIYKIFFADENNEKILELERKLREAVEFNKAVETKNEAMATEVQKMKSDVEKVCGERDLLQANHTMLLQQMRTPSPAYTKKAPPPSAMTCGQSASLGMSQSHYQARTQQHFTQPQTMQSRSESPYTQYSRPPTHDPTHRMS